MPWTLCSPCGAAKPAGNLEPEAASAHPNFFVETVRSLVDEDCIPVAQVRAFIAASPPPADAHDSAAWQAWRSQVAEWHVHGKAAPVPAPSTNLTAVPPPPTTSAKYAAGLGVTAGCWIAETAARAVTVPQLRAIYALARELCVSDSWKSGLTGEPVVPDELNLYDLVSNVIKPATRGANCSIAELVASAPQPPHFFVSHWWGEPVQEFITCLERLLKDRALPEATTNFWVCAYALRQWDLGAELSGGVEVSPFVRALLLADGAVSVLDRCGIYFTRAWCLLELYKSLVDSRSVFLHDIVTTTPWLLDRRGNKVPAVCLLDGFAERDFAFSQSKAAREAPFPRSLIEQSQAFGLDHAEASEARDLAAIIDAIGTERAQLEATVRARFAAVELGSLLARAAPAEPAVAAALAEPAQSAQQPQPQPPTAAGAADIDATGATAAVEEELRRALTDLQNSCVRKLSVSVPRDPPSVGPSSSSQAGKGGAPSAAAAAAAAAAAVSAPPLGLATSADGALALARAFPATLTDLRLDRLHAALAPAVCALTSRGQLLHLQLRHCQPSPLCDADARALADAASADACRLLTLDLEGNSIGADGARALADALRKNQTLRTLSVKRNALGDDGARAIGAALQGQRVLLHLDLSENGVGEEAKNAVLDAAYEPPDKSTLERVNL